MTQVNYTTLPSSLVYSINVPEVKNFSAEFVYNFFVVDETINDSGQVSQEVADVSRVMVKKKNDGSLEYLNINNTPRYVKLSFSAKINNSNGITVGNFNSITGESRKNLLNSIVHEEDFASDSFTTINTDNDTIEKQTSVVFDKNLKETISTINTSFDKINDNVNDALLVATSLQAQSKGANFADSLISSRFEDLRKVNFTGQISNNVVYDLFLFSSGSYGTNNSFFSSNLDFAKKQTEKNKNLKFSISDSEFKPSIKKYSDAIQDNSLNKSSGGGATSNLKKELIGYLIEKIELLSDGTTRVHDSIVISDGMTSSYLDYKVRYGAVYAYQIRGLYRITYPAVDSETLEFKQIDSIVSSRTEMKYIEAIEEIAPPPPAELRFMWDYDRFNPTTAIYDPTTGIPFPGTGTRGSLVVSWSFPNNRQLDIKKFQIFRRKSVDDPFELLKMIDFDDSVDVALNKFFSKEDLINSSLVQRSVITRQNLPTISAPINFYYDDDFAKTSKYIYTVASVDAHGLSSNYSEQFMVSFDEYNNKLVTKLVSIAGAPKPYPNMYLQQDLFVDTIKTSNKKNMSVYLTPECYDVSNGKNSSIPILSYGKTGAEYVINFVNTDSAIGTTLNINIDGDQVK
jgi:hypothetical protein